MTGGDEVMCQQLEFAFGEFGEMLLQDFRNFGVEDTTLLIQRGFVRRVADERVLENVIRVVRGSAAVDEFRDEQFVEPTSQAAAIRYQLFE